MRTAASWRAGVATDPGLERSNNEDRVFADEAAGIFLVVDGIGGQAAGEKAAEIAVEIISRFLTGFEGAPEEGVRESITAANNEIYRLAQSRDEWRGMACVLTLALAHEDRITVGHVGDSRMYLAWDGKLRKLTSDHSPVGEREDLGELTEEEAMAHPRRNQVFRDVGSRPREAWDEDFIEIRDFPFHADAAFLLCSDGLTDTVPSSKISGIVETYDGNPEVIAKRLIDAANRAGGKDNISVVLLAGPQFVGSDSHRMKEARTRHAITRVRSGFRWKVLFSRMVWLAAGVLLGILMWDAASRFAPRRPSAGMRDSLARTASAPILVNASDPAGIVKALAIAQPGDVLEVPPGEFLGPIELKDQVNLISQNPGAAVIRVDPSAVWDAGIAFAARGVHKGRLSGFRVLGDANMPLATGVLLDDSSLEVDDLEISGARDCGIRIAGSSAPVLRANFVHDNFGCGIWIGGGSVPRVVGNRISENGVADLRSGVEIHLPAKPTIENNIIVGNGAANFGSVPAAIEDGIRRNNIVN